MGKRRESGEGFAPRSETHRGPLCEKAEFGSLERVRLGHGAVGAFEAIADQFAEGARQAEIKRTVADILATRDAADWMAAFQNTDSCVNSVVTVTEAGEPRPMPWLASTPPQPGTAVPKLGEHTREVLAASGLTEDEIHALG